MAAADILVVEDSAIQAELLRREMVGKGLAVRLARDGAEGLAALRAQRADLVISDVTMPVMDGYAMCQAIKGDPALRDVPVILLTALSDVTDVIRGLSAGADAYITKPFDPARLAERARHLLDHPPAAPPAGEDSPLTLELAGERHAVTAGRAQILDLLVSTYENAVLQNRELHRMQEALRALNEQLEQRVRERTAALAAEEARAREAELRYRTLFEQLSDGALLVDPASLAMIEFNDAAFRQLGHTRAEFATLTLRDLALPEARPAIEGCAHEAVLRGHEAVEIGAAARDGARREVRVTMKAIELGGRPLLHCVLHDITEERRSQALAIELRVNAERIGQLEREIAAFERLAPRDQAPAGGQARATGEAFVRNVERYAHLLDLAVERQAYRVEHDVSGALGALAEELGTRRAGARDVVEIHGQALRQKVGGLKPELKWAYNEEGRLMVLELMGHLAGYYRDRSSLQSGTTGADRRPA